MFVSRVEIPWDAARNPYEIHRRLWCIFPAESREPRMNADETRQGFLYRIEENPPGRSARVLVQSRRPPEAVPGVALLGTREFNPRPTIGQRLAFLVTANPVKTVMDEKRDDKPGKKSEKCRVPLLKDQDQRAWIARKLAGAADVEAVSVVPHAPTYFRKGNQGGKVVTVSFDGVLTVCDPAALIDRMENGIGPAKAFGCGLLLVRRLG